jgi:hypothetical protein
VTETDWRGGPPPRRRPAGPPPLPLPPPLPSDDGAGRRRRRMVIVGITCVVFGAGGLVVCAVLLLARRDVGTGLLPHPDEGRVMTVIEPRWGVIEVAHDWEAFDELQRDPTAHHRLEGRMGVYLRSPGRVRVVRVKGSGYEVEPESMRRRVEPPKRRTYIIHRRHLMREEGE